MSYNFYARADAVGNAGSGCTETVSPVWSGTVTINDNVVTKVSGDNFPQSLLDGNHFIRLDPYNAVGVDSNIRIVSGNATTLVLAESVFVEEEIDANIGGAFLSLEEFIGTASITSKIPYANGSTINDVINMYVGYGLYVLNNTLKPSSSTQDSVCMRRNIIGLKSDGSQASFVDGVFDGPIISNNTSVIFINACEVTVDGLKLYNTSTNSGAVCGVMAGKYNIGLRHLYVVGGIGGISSADGSSSNIQECLIEDVNGKAILGYNSYVSRCVSKRCYYAWSGSLSSFCECVEYDTINNLGFFTGYPVGSDFSFCRFTSDKQFMFTKGQLNFNRCTFDHSLDLSGCGLGGQGGDITLENCVVAGTFIPLLNTCKSIYPAANTVIENAGIDDYARIFEPALNLESHFPDPVLDKYCKYSTAGPHEYRMPVEAVGARALRCRERVSRREVGL
jgi:hypothetical protein